MQLDDLALLGRELATALEDRVREDELADVVDQAGRMDELLLVVAKVRQPRRAHASSAQPLHECRAVIGSRSERVLSITDSIPACIASS